MMFLILCNKIYIYVISSAHNDISKNNTDQFWMIWIVVYVVSQSSCFVMCDINNNVDGEMEDW